MMVLYSVLNIFIGIWFVGIRWFVFILNISWEIVSLYIWFFLRLVIMFLNFGILGLVLMLFCLIVILFEMFIFFGSLVDFRIFSLICFFNLCLYIILMYFLWYYCFGINSGLYNIIIMLIIIIIWKNIVSYKFFDSLEYIILFLLFL